MYNYACCNIACMYCNTASVYTSMCCNIVTKTKIDYFSSVSSVYLQLKHEENAMLNIHFIHRIHNYLSSNIANKIINDIVLKNCFNFKFTKLKVHSFLLCLVEYSNNSHIFVMK